MSDLLARARLLREHRRHEEAVAMLHQHLAQEPDDPFGHIELALNRMNLGGQEMLELALEDARRGCGLRPGDWFPLALQARILCLLKRHTEGLKLAEAAIAMDPEKVHAWNTKTIALADTGQLAQAERSARHACALAPDSADATNLLALVLRMQGRLDESVAESQRMLARDPENSIAFTNHGMAALQRHEVKQAESHFKEALRLDPNSRQAKEGLKQAYYQRSAPYRFTLGLANVMQRHPWIFFPFLLSAVAATGILTSSGVPPVGALTLAMILLFYLIFYWVIVMPGLAHFVILRDPVARLSLDPPEKRNGIVVTSLVLGGLLLLVCACWLRKLGLLTAGFVLLAAAIPFSRAFIHPSRWKRGTHLFLGSFILAQGLYSAWQILITPRDLPYTGLTLPGLFVCMLLTILATAIARSDLAPRR